MGYHTIKTALERVDDMNESEKRLFGLMGASNQLGCKNDALGGAALLVIPPPTSGLIGMRPQQAPEYDPQFKQFNAPFGTTLYPVRRDAGFAYFEDGCACRDGVMVERYGLCYDARIPEEPPVRKQAPPEFTKLTEDDDMKEDHNEVLLDEITTRFRKSNRLMGWAGVVIAFLALMAATESKWMPIVNSIAGFKRAPAQISGEETIMGQKVMPEPALIGIEPTGKSIRFLVKRGSAMFLPDAKLHEDWLADSNRIYTLGFEKAATTSNCTIYYVPAGMTNLTKLELETIGTEYHEKPAINFITNNSPNVWIFKRGEDFVWRDVVSGGELVSSEFCVTNVIASNKCWKALCNISLIAKKESKTP